MIDITLANGKIYQVKESKTGDPLIINVVATDKETQENYSVVHNINNGADVLKENLFGQILAREKEKDTKPTAVENELKVSMESETVETLSAKTSINEKIV
jgi:hypothetical protein